MGTPVRLPRISTGTLRASISATFFRPEAEGRPRGLLRVLSPQGLSTKGEVFTIVGERFDFVFTFLLFDNDKDFSFFLLCVPELARSAD